MHSIRDHILKIGEEMFTSHPAYPEAALDKFAGIVPRCLIFEEKGRDPSARGSVVVGINPGFSDEPERAYYVRRGCTYEATIDYWHAKVRNVRYYTSLATFLNAAGLKGPVLWTELVHCELRDKKTRLTIQTIRDSINRYLFRQLEVIPKSWPLIAVGKDVFPILAYRFPDRQIIGVPHPTGSYGQFPKLCSAGKLNPTASKQLTEIITSGAPIAVSFEPANASFV